MMSTATAVLLSSMAALAAGQTGEADEGCPDINLDGVINVNVRHSPSVQNAPPRVPDASQSC